MNFYNIKQVCDLLNIKKESFYRLYSKGDFKIFRYIKIGRRIYFFKKDVDEFYEKNK